VNRASRALALGVALGVGACGGARTSADFGRGGDETPLTGSTPNVVPLPVHAAWRLELAEGPLYTVKPRELSAAAYSSTLGRVAIGTTEGWFVCARAGSGEILWRKRLAGGVSARAIFDGDRILTGTDDGQVLALSAYDGAELWRYTVPSAVQQAPIVVGGLVVFVDGHNGVHAVDRDSGAWRWQFRRDPPEEFALAGEAGVLVADGRIYTGFSDGHAVALDARDGAVLWTRDLAPEHDRFQDVDARPVRLGLDLFVASAASGLHALDPYTGKIRFTVPLPGVTRLTSVDGQLIASVDRGEVVRINPRDGSTVWQARLPGGAPGDVVSVGGLLATSMSRGGVFFLDAATGRPLQHFLPGYGLMGAPTAGDDGTLYVFSNGGVLYGFSAGPRT